MKLKALAASAAVSGTLLAGAPIASAQTQVGLVNVNVGAINVNVPVNAAISIAANVCNIDLDVNVLAAVWETGETNFGDCDSNSRAFAEQPLEITNLTA